MLERVVTPALGLFNLETIEFIIVHRDLPFILKISYTYICINTTRELVAVYIDDVRDLDVKGRSCDTSRPLYRRYFIISSTGCFRSIANELVVLKLIYILYVYFYACVSARQGYTNR